MRVAVVLFLVGCKGKDEGATDTGGGGPTGTGPGDLDRVTTTVWPSKRSEIWSAPHVGTNSILIFGGNEGPIVDQIPTSDFLGDTWVFEPGKGWTEVDGDSPSKRGRYAMAVDEVGGRAFLFGGRFRPADEGGNYTLYNDLWEFDFEARTWTLLDDGSSPGAPPPRYYGQGAWDAQTGTLYVWGGNLNVDPLVFDVTDELWAYKDGQWEQLETSGEAPSDRSFLGSTHDLQRNKLVIFGGQRGDLSSLAYNDSFALSLDTLEWKELDDGDDDPVPSTRMHTRLVWDAERDRYVLFGGHTDVGDMNDLWGQDPGSGDWSRVYIADKFTDVGLGCNDNPSEVPADYVEMDLSAPERRHNGMVALMWDSIWVYGGIHAECSNQLDDTWRFDLATETWHELVPATSGESCLRRAEDCECLCL